MGAYLSAPVTNKEFFEGSSPDVIYGGASMQVCLLGDLMPQDCCTRRLLEDTQIVSATISCVCVL